MTTQKTRKVSYNGPIGKRMLAAERRTKAEILSANKEGLLGEGYDSKAARRLETKGQIEFLHAINHLRGGYMVTGWKKPLERSYYGSYGTKLWSPVTKKLVKKSQ